jgi:hypothetical protein
MSPFDPVEDDGVDEPEYIVTKSISTVTLARLVTFTVPFALMVWLPLTNSLADTDTAVPFFVPPVIYPVEFVTEGVIETE